MSDLKWQTAEQLKASKAAAEKYIGQLQGKLNNQQERLRWINHYLAAERPLAAPPEEGPRVARITSHDATYSLSLAGVDPEWHEWLIRVLEKHLETAYRQGCRHTRDDVQRKARELFAAVGLAGE